jgi:hypothetical protein
MPCCGGASAGHSVLSQPRNSHRGRPAAPTSWQLAHCWAFPYVVPLCSRTGCTRPAPALNRLLEESQIGTVVRGLRAFPGSDAVRRLATALVDKWRQEVAGAAKRKRKAGQLPARWSGGAGSSGGRGGA